jgi:putative DNA primase/helicase
MNDEVNMENIVQLAEMTKPKRVVVTEDSAALAFAERYKGQLLFDHDSGSWFRWDGNHWKRERTRLAFNWARDLSREMTENEPIKVKAIGRKTTFSGGVEKFSQADPIFAVTGEDWNSDPFLLATPNGTIDLRTGKIRPADPDDRINRITAIGPLGIVDCPQWLKFLDEATGKDDELIAFLQRWCGYCLTGDISEHALVFCYGPGGNGKGVFLNTVSGILSKYAATAAMESLTASKYAQHPTDLAMLAGARLVTASETEEGRAWAESRIKQMTGGDPITARFMRCNFFTYSPNFKLTIIGNHEPTLRSVDDAMCRRFNIIPFIRKPPVVDKELPKKLWSEWPGILRWMIEGCLAWQETGLAPPKTVRVATASYFENQDLFGQWIQEKCNAAPGDKSKAGTSADLFKSWSAFAKAAGDIPGSRKSFARMLERRGFVPHRKGPSQIRAYYGIEVTHDADEDGKLL